MSAFDSSSVIVPTAPIPQRRDNFCPARREAVQRIPAARVPQFIQHWVPPRLFRWLTDAINLSGRAETR